MDVHVVDDAGDTDDGGYDYDDDCDVSNLRVMITRLDMAEDSLVKRLPLSYARNVGDVGSTKHEAESDGRGENIAYP